MIKHIRKINERSASLLLLLLFCADIIFNLLHILKHTIVPTSSLFDIQIESYLNIYHLIKLFWVIVLLIYILRTTGYSGYLSWIFLFTFFLINDTLLLHQVIGDHIANSIDKYLPTILGQQPRFLELSVLAITVSCLLCFVCWTYFRGQNPFKKISKDLFLFIIFLVFFGIIVDLGSLLKLGPAVLMGLVIVEDGGEMVIYSLILWYVFLLAVRYGKPDLFIHDSLGNYRK